MNYKRKKTFSNKYVAEKYGSQEPKSSKSGVFKRFCVAFIFFFALLGFLGKISPVLKVRNILKDTPAMKYYIACENFAKKRFETLSHMSKKGATFVSTYLKSGEKKNEKVFALEPSASSSAETEKIDGKTFSPALPCSGEVSSPFGEREHPINGEGSFHNGIDIASEAGSEVKSTDDGTVTKSTYNQYSGNYIVISHHDGYTSSYAHLSESRVKEGDKVKKGDVIGLVGSTGSATGPHLHFEIRRSGEPLDPIELISR